MQVGRWLQHMQRLVGTMLISVALLEASSDASAAQRAGAPAHGGDTVLAPYRFRVLGVFDAESGQPVMDADVTNLLTGVGAKTSRTGTVALSFLPDGGGMVRIRKLGYAMQTLTVAISPADTAPVTVVLTPAVQLPEVVTRAQLRYLSPNLRGFEERKRTGLGYYIDEKTLRKDENRALGDVLVSHVPGINIVPGHGSRMLLMKSRRCMVGGPPEVYVDGVQVHYFPAPTAQLFRRLRKGRPPPSVGPIDLSQFDVTNLAAVEYYPDNAMAPMEYNGTSKRCGVLLLWTREK